MAKANQGANFGDTKNLAVSLLDNLAKEVPTTKDRKQVLAVEIPEGSFTKAERETVVQIVSMAFQNQGIANEDICWVEGSYEKARFEITFTNESGPKTFKSNIETMKKYLYEMKPEEFATAVKSKVRISGKNFLRVCNGLFCNAIGRGGSNRSAA